MIRAAPHPQGTGGKDLAWQPQWNYMTSACFQKHLQGICWLFESVLEVGPGLWGAGHTKSSGNLSYQWSGSPGQLQEEAMWTDLGMRLVMCLAERKLGQSRAELRTKKHQWIEVLAGFFCPLLLPTSTWPSKGDPFALDGRKMCLQGLGRAVMSRERKQAKVRRQKGKLARITKSLWPEFQSMILSILW